MSFASPSFPSSSPPPPSSSSSSSSSSSLFSEFDSSSSSFSTSSLPSDLIACLHLLHSQSPPLFHHHPLTASSSSLSIPRVILLNQLYSLLRDHTQVDKELCELRQRNEVRMFKLLGSGVDDFALVWREEYEEWIRSMRPREEEVEKEARERNGSNSWNLKEKKKEGNNLNSSSNSNNDLSLSSRSFPVSISALLSQPVLPSSSRSTSSAQPELVQVKKEPSSGRDGGEVKVKRERNEANNEESKIKRRKVRANNSVPSTTAATSSTPARISAAIRQLASSVTSTSTSPSRASSLPSSPSSRSFSPSPSPSFSSSSSSSSSSSLSLHSQYQLLSSFLTNVLPHYHDVSIPRELLLSLLRLPHPPSSFDSFITFFIHMGILSLRTSTSYWFLCPQAALLTLAIVNGRKEIVGLIQRKKYKEMFVKELEEKSRVVVRVKGSDREMRWHVREMIGSGRLEVIETTSGKLLRVAQKGR